MTSDTSKNKVQEISDLLYKEAILPAKDEAGRIILEAKEEAFLIIQKAHQEARELFEINEKQMIEERKVFESSITQAVKQAVISLKSDVMNLFRKDLLSNLKTTLNQQQLLQGVVKSLLKAVESEGLKCDMKLCVSKEVNFDDLSDSIIASLEKKLEKGDLIVSSGVELILKDKKIALKITEKTCMDLLADKLPQILKSKVFS